MYQLFNDLPEAVYNTIEIAEKCSFKPDIKKPILPVFPVNDQTEKELITKLSNEGLELRLKEKFALDNDEY